MPYNAVFEAFWVGSNGVAPLTIFFNPVEAFDSSYAYLDAFDDEGNKRAVYFRVLDAGEPTRWDIVSILAEPEPTPPAPTA